MFDIKFLRRNQFEQYAEALFSVLYDNMSWIAPIGNSREEAFSCWFDANKKELKNENRHIIIIVQKEINEIAAFFKYSVQNDVFFMEEIQIRKSYQGKYNLFEKIYKFVFDNMRDGVRTVEAYADKRNIKSVGILRKLGLTIVGENKTGISYHFRGAYADLLNWYNGIDSIESMKKIDKS